MKDQKHNRVIKQFILMCDNHRLVETLLESVPERDLNTLAVELYKKETDKIRNDMNVELKKLDDLNEQMTGMDRIQIDDFIEFESNRYEINRKINRLNKKWDRFSKLFSKIYD